MLAGKLALVTGAASGIGLEVAKLFAQQKASVIAVDLNETVKSLINELNKEDNQTHTAFVVDVSNSEQVNDLFNSIKDAYPLVKAPNVVVNSAGIYTCASFLEMTEAEFDRVIAVNLKGTFLVTQAAARVLVENYQEGIVEDDGTYASIVNLASIAARHGMEFGSHYSASKAAVEGLTRSIAKELAKYKIRCNAVLPGLIETPMVRNSQALHSKEEAIKRLTPLARLGKASEVAQACLFLASNMSSYMTGEGMLYTGGLYS